MSQLERGCAMSFVIVPYMKPDKAQLAYVFLHTRTQPFVFAHTQLCAKDGGAPDAENVMPYSL